MSEHNFKPGDLVKHVHFTAPRKLFVVKILDNGGVGCRYQSFISNEKATSNFQLHYAEFEPFELEPIVRVEGGDTPGIYAFS